MGYVTKYGTIWGAIPQTAGRVFWVAPSASYTVEGRAYPASDQNDGLSPERALLTLAQAVTNATASVGDVIVLLPGAHSWSASAALSKAGLTVMGLPSGKGHPMRQRASITTSAADEIINITAADIELAYLHIIPVTAQRGIDITDVGRIYIHDCSIDLTPQTASTSTIGISTTTSAALGASQVVIENVYTTSFGGQGPGLALGDCMNSEVIGCTFRLYGNTAWADAITIGTGARDVIVQECRFLSGSGTAITDTIDLAANTDDAAVQWIRNYRSASAGVPNAAADADITATMAETLFLGTTAAGTTADIGTINAG